MLKIILPVGGKGWVCEINNRIAGFANCVGYRSQCLGPVIERGSEKKGIGLKLHDKMMDWYFTQLPNRSGSALPRGQGPKHFTRKAGWREAGTHGKGEIKFE
jgi:hypothetical protein